MKTLLKLLGITVLVTVIGFAISCGGGAGGGTGTTPPPGGNPEDPPVIVPGCDHNWSDWLVIHIPAETVPGSAVPMTEKRTCSICGSAETRSTTTFVPTVIIDLTSGSVTGAVNTTPPDITISPDASDVVLIIGDGSNGGAGRGVLINNATQIYIADGVTIIFSAFYSIPLTVPGGSSITGGGAVTINSNAAPAIFTGGGGGDLTISGTISAITSVSTPAIAGSSNYTITGMIGALTSGSNVCLHTSGDYIDISGTIGDINGGISAKTGITISGTTGAITGRGSFSGIGISGNGNITISGTTGAIKGSDNASGEGGTGIQVTGTGTVTITGTVGSNTADDIKGGLGDNPPLNNGAQIKVNGTSYNDWPAVKSWS